MDHQETKDLKTKRKEKRKRLFHHSKPNIRTFEGLDDLLWLWTSYKLENPETEHTEQSFIQEFGNVFLSYDFVYVIEDGNKKLPENHGIIAFVYGVVDDDGWKYEPHVHYMMWATKKNILRTTIAYLQKMRFSKQVGFISIFAKDKHKNLFDKAWEYLDLRKIKSIPNFYPDGSVNLYMLRGNRNAQ